jgi:hypothetical protein
VVRGMVGGGSRKAESRDWKKKKKMKKVEGRREKN